MSRRTVTVARSVADLAARLEREKDDAPVRVHRMDGSVVEGDAIDITSLDLVLVYRATGEQVKVPAHELRTVEVHRTLRGRELLLAVVGIAAVTAFLVAFTQLPWIPSDGRGAFLGFIVLGAAITGVMSIHGVRDRVYGSLARWERLYSVLEDDSE